MRILEFIARIPFRVIIGANIILILAGAVLAASYVYPASPQHGAAKHIVGIEAANNNTPVPAPQAVTSTASQTTDSQTPIPAPAISQTNVTSPAPEATAEPMPEPLPPVQPQPQATVTQPNPPAQPAPVPPCLETADPTNGGCSPCSCWSTGKRHLCPMIACYPICGNTSSDIACRIY